MSPRRSPSHSACDMGGKPCGGANPLFSPFRPRELLRPFLPRRRRGPNVTKTRCGILSELVAARSLVIGSQWGLDAALSGVLQGAGPSSRSRSFLPPLGPRSRLARAARSAVGPGCRRAYLLRGLPLPQAADRAVHGSPRFHRGIGSWLLTRALVKRRARAVSIGADSTRLDSYSGERRQGAAIGRNAGAGAMRGREPGRCGASTGIEPGERVLL